MEAGNRVRRRGKTSLLQEEIKKKTKTSRNAIMLPAKEEWDQDVAASASQFARKKKTAIAALEGGRKKLASYARKIPREEKKEKREWNVCCQAKT